MFSWIPIHKETASKIISLSNPQQEMLAVLREMSDRGLRVISLEDQGPN